MHKFTYALFYLFALFSILMPSPVRKAFFITLAYLIYLIDAKHRRIIRVNLHMAFGDTLSQQRIKQLTIGCFKNLALDIMSVIETYFLPLKWVMKDVSYVGVEHIEKAHAQKRPVIYFTAHYNDLQVGSLMLARMSQTIVQSGQEASNPYIHAFINKGREQLGSKMVTLTTAMRGQARQLRNGGDISIVVDQSVDGTFVEFFGHKTVHTISASKLGLKYNAVIIPSIVLKDSKGDLQATFFKPLEYTPTGNEQEDIQALTQMQASFIEEIIKKDPEPWFWCHKRWKVTYPEIYKK